MGKDVPILLSFYALSNGSSTIAFGQLTHTDINDFSFKDYSRRKTFRTLFRLYQTKPFANQKIILDFSSGEVAVETNSYGGFYLNKAQVTHGTLQRVVLDNGEPVKIIEGLYDKTIHHFRSSTVVVSDIDDTLVHSYIYKKIRKFRTLMFTTMEKRKAVINMQELIRQFTDSGAEPVYLSNSEQNLYPIIYRFLQHNKFPRGPLFLKQLRSLWQVLLNIKFPIRNIHKTTMLEDLLKHFPDKKFVLMGDNTQHDLAIYLSMAEKFPNNIRLIVIRKVVEKKGDDVLISNAMKQLKDHQIHFFYDDHFPASFEIA